MWVNHSIIEWVNECTVGAITCELVIKWLAGIPQNISPEDMHVVWFSMWDGFFSPRVSESRPSRVATRVGLGDEWWEIHLTCKTIQNAFSRILYTLRHFNQAKYNVQNCRSWKSCEMDLSHNCSLHGGRSEVCDNNVMTSVMNNLSLAWCHLCVIG